MLSLLSRPPVVRRVLLRSPAELTSIIHVRDSALVVVLAGCSTPADLALTEALRERGNVVVFAPFEPGERWTVHRWQPTSGWRGRYLEWVAARIEVETLLEPTALGELLEREDPKEVLFSTPRDLLALCRYVHEHGERKLARQLKKTGWADAADGACHIFLQDIQGSRTDVDLRWLRAEGGRAVRALVEMRFDEMAFPMTGGLDSPD